MARYAKRVRALIRRQREADRTAETWLRALGERAEGRAGLLAIETVRSLALDALAEIGARKESLTLDEIARLALALRRIEGADRLRLVRERELAEVAARRREPVRGRGLSPETVAAIRRAVLGEPPPCPEQGPFGSMTPAAPEAAALWDATDRDGPPSGSPQATVLGDPPPCPEQEPFGHHD